MVEIDLDTLQEISELITGLSDRCEDSLGQLQILNNEISYDIEFLLNSRSGALLQNVEEGINQMRIMDDIFHGLKNIFTTLPNEYIQIDRSGEEIFEKNITEMIRIDKEVEKKLKQKLGD